MALILFASVPSAAEVKEDVARRYHLLPPWCCLVELFEKFVRPLHPVVLLFPGFMKHARTLLAPAPV